MALSVRFLLGFRLLVVGKGWVNSRLRGHQHVGNEAIGPVLRIGLPPGVLAVLGQQFVQQLLGEEFVQCSIPPRSIPPPSSGV